MEQDFDTILILEEDNKEFRAGRDLEEKEERYYASSDIKKPDFPDLRQLPAKEKYVFENENTIWIIFGKKDIKPTDEILNKLEYLGLDLDKLPKAITNFEELEYRIPKFYEENKYRQYRYVDVKDIQILITPTNRLDELEEKYKKASPIFDYLDNKTEENYAKHAKFLEMLKNVKINDNEKIEKELFKNITDKIKQEIQTTVQELKSKTKDEIVEERYQKFRKISGFKEV